MKSSLSFSVVIPVYNNRDTLARAIESVLSQTLPAHEIFVIDDGSADGSPALAQSLFGEKIQVFSFQENRGPSAARNAGIEAATGTHIAFLDADDAWRPEKLARMAAAIEAHPQALLLFHDHALSSQNPGNEPAKPYPFRRFLMRNPVATPCAVVRKTNLRFNEQLRWMEDYDFFLRLAELGPVYHVPQALTVLGRPILSAGGQSSRRWQMRKAEGKVIEKLAQRRPYLYPLLPLWILAFLSKHLLQELRRMR